MQTFGLDTPPVTRDEATELCVYHLQMACAYFQVVPDDGNASLLTEIKRKVSDDKYALDACKAWAEAILIAYEADKEVE